MKWIKEMSWLIVPLSLALLVTACATYYKVRDPATGDVYYTEDVKQGGTGAAMFKDARSGSAVTIQNSEITEISEQEYKAGVSTPAPAPAPK
ncbi:MAG TPA: hypothetical protein VMN77_02790 [Nitrospiria bacterium]|nr:hypothetical protein [Nitrospiria bacterium]